MLELFDTKPEVRVQDSEYQRLLGYPARHVLEGRARELAEATRRWYAENGRPWIYAREVEAEDFSGDEIRIAGTGFNSVALRGQFNSAPYSSAMLVAVSAGAECEDMARRYWHESKPDEYFFMEMFGSAVVENLIALANGRICGWADQRGMLALPHYSPGYSGWDVSDQTRLWKLIHRNGNEFPGEIEVMDTGMLRPKKSLLAVVGLTRHLDKARRSLKMVPCENCALPGCQYRRAPCLSAPPQIEGAAQLQPVMDDARPKPANRSGLDHHAKYSVNLRALRKWSQERLQLKTLHDGAVEARFRYEGTTCSNMGRPLEFDYHLLLSPGREQFVIRKASCGPAPGDTGHALQCEYLKDPVGFMKTITEERPLLGQPLNAVLTWKRAAAPSGCYCDADRRAHKWGLVLEVIHFALVQRELDENG